MGPDVAFYLIVMKGMQLAKGLQVLSANLSAFFLHLVAFFNFFIWKFQYILLGN